MQLLLCWILILGWDCCTLKKEGTVSVISVFVSFCLCLCLFCLSFDVATSFWENEKSDAKSLSHVKIWWHPTALQIPNKRWLHAGPRCCVISQALEVCLLALPLLLLLLVLPLVGLTAYPAFVFSRPTDIQSSTMWRSLKVLGSRRFGIRVHSFLGWWWWWWWFLPSSETPTDCSCRH